MGKYYKDTEHFYEIMGNFFDRLITNEALGEKLSKAGLIIKFIYTDPDAEITIDLKNPPKEEGHYGSYYLGACDIKEDVWSKQSGDFSHSFWHGHENPVMALAKGKVKQGGNVTKMLKLLPIVKPAFAMFPKVLEETGKKDLVIKKKGWF